jgi:hypothetical protein
MKRFAVISLLLLGGCQTAAERMAAIQARNADADDRQCQSFGARPGTDAYISCRTQLEVGRRNEPPPPAAPVVVQAPAAPTTTSCLRTGTMVTCNTM